jgi:hypothetical protein
MRTTMNFTPPSESAALNNSREMRMAAESEHPKTMGPREAVEQGLYERLNSPLLFSFALSWCAWNYDALLILLSENSVTDKLAMMTRIAFPDGLTVAWKAVMGPLASALAYIFFYPLAARWVRLWHWKVEIATRYKEAQVRGEDVLTHADAAQVRRDRELAVASVSAENVKLSQANAQAAASVIEAKERVSFAEQTRHQFAATLVNITAQHFDRKLNNDQRAAAREVASQILNCVDTAGLVNAKAAAMGQDPEALSWTFQAMEAVRVLDHLPDGRYRLANGLDFD